jgi:proline racemase
MADSKVSELTSATSAGGSDVLYLVQSSTSKKITVANLFNDISNPTFTGNVKVGGTPQTLSSPGIVSITTPITHLSVDAVGGTLNIPTGADGQVKYLVLTASAGGTYALNTSNISANANVLFDQVGDSAQLLYTNNKWFVVGGTANVTY